MNKTIWSGASLSRFAQIIDYHLGGSEFRGKHMLPPGLLGQKAVGYFPWFGNYLLL